jgi:type IV secretion system protein VirB6
VFDWIGLKFDSVLNNYVLGVVTSLMTAIAPIALVGFTLWVLLYGWAVLRNQVSETVPDFAWKAVKISFILAFALQASFYISNVADTANALAMGVASTFLPAGVDPNTVTSAYTLLDKFNDAASEQVADIMKEASMFRLDLVLAAVIFSFGSVIFLCVALFIVTLAKVLMTFVIAIGPLFILTLGFKQTARFFDSWLSMVLNAVVLTWFAFFALGLSTYMGDAIFQAIRDGGGFLGPNFNVLAEATRYCVLMILMAILCFQAPTLASALTGGAVVQQGIQMVQNAMMVSGLRSAAAGRAAAAGGVVRGGGGVAFNAGRAVRAARQIPAYMAAALRGQDWRQR